MLSVLENLVSDKPKLFKAMYDVRLSSVHGHIVVMKAGEIKELPPSLQPVALTNGCVPAEGEEVAKQEKEETKSEAPAEAQQNKTSFTDENSEKKEKLFSVFRRMIDSGKQTYFTKDGYPRNNLVKEFSNISLTTRERDLYWESFQDEYLKNATK